MTKVQFEVYRQICGEFKEYVEELIRSMPWLLDAQEGLRQLRGYEDYRIELPVVYNLALDDIKLEDEIQFIFVADNPGKNEQKASNQRYLVGQAGKLAEGWFRKELKIDFRKAGIIINKTPIHTPKTAELRLLAAQCGEHRAEFLDKLKESELMMARFAFRLQTTLNNTLWVSGYGELANGKLFAPWAEELTRLYTDPSMPSDLSVTSDLSVPSDQSVPSAMRDKVWVFRHFSMNQFAIEYKAECQRETVAAAGLDPLDRYEVLHKLGVANRRRILGW